MALDLLQRLGVSLPSAPLRVLGIDLGTTNSITAEVLWDPGRPDPLRVRCLEASQPTETGEYISTVVPSVVAIHGAQIWVGEGAKRLRGRAATPDTRGRSGVLTNKNLFYEVKNEIGTAKTYPFAPAGLRSPKEVSARILRYLGDNAQPGADPLVAGTVVTVPASFQAAQRLDTIEAARLAGLTLGEGDLLDEPLAVFLDWVMTHGVERLQKLDGKATLLVFDFGGGTCDTAVFELGRDRPTGCVSVASLAVSRYHRLGGGDIDRVIAHSVLMPQVEEQNSLGTFSLGYEEKMDLIEALLGVAEALKISLCTDIARLEAFGKYDEGAKTEVVARQPYALECPVGRRTLCLRSARMSAAQFEALLQPFLDQDLLYARETEYYLTRSVFAPLRDALDRSGLQPGDIDMCLLAGGSSLIPQVRQAVSAYFPSAEMLEYDSDETLLTSVARGAAYHALFRQTLGHGLLTPVAHDSISLKTSQGRLEIIEAGTRLPFPSTDPLFQSVDRLTVPETSLVEPLPLRIEVVAGEEQRPVYTALWHLDPPVERGQALLLTYRCDSNQILYLKLRTQRVGQTPQWHDIQIENPLTNVVNPQPERIIILELEERIRTGQVPRDQMRNTLIELADRYVTLGQREKAIALLTRVPGPDPGALNRMALLCGELGDTEREEKLFRRAADDTGWTGALFNLALSQHRRKDYRSATDTLELALHREPEASYFVLRAMLSEETGDEQGRTRYLNEAVRRYGPPASLSEWELGWLLKALRMRGDANRSREVEHELRKRSTGRSSDDPPTGFLPGMRL